MSAAVVLPAVHSSSSTLLLVSDVLAVSIASAKCIRLPVSKSEPEMAVNSFIKLGVESCKLIIFPRQTR